MFEYSKKLMDKIRNKEDLEPEELRTIERCLRLYDVNTSILEYQIGSPLCPNNIFELTETITR